MMKMLMVVVPKKNGDDLLSALLEAGYSATFFETRGSMLRRSQITMFIALNETEVPKVLGIIRRSCLACGQQIHYGYGLPLTSETLDDVVVEKVMPVEDDPNVRSGAVVFIWTLDQFELP